MPGGLLEVLGLRLPRSRKAADPAAAPGAELGRAVDAILAELDRSLGDVLQHCAPGVHSQLATARDDALAERAQRPELALKALKDVQKEVHAALSARERGLRAWEATARDRAAIEQRLAALESGPQAEMARPVRSAYALATALAEVRRDHEAAAARVPGVLAELGVLEQRVAAIAKLGETSRKLQSAAAAQIASLEAQALQVAQRAGMQAPPAELAERIGALRTSWLGGIARAPDEAAKNAADAAGQAERATLARTIEQLLKADPATDPDLKALKDGETARAANAKALADFRAKAQTQLLHPIDEVENIQGRAAAPLRQQAQELLARAAQAATPEAWTALRAELDAAIRQVAEQRRGANDQLAQTLRGPQQRHDKFKARLDAAQAAQKKKDTPNALLLAELQRKLGRVRLMIDSGNVDVAAEADQQLNLLQAEFDDIERNWEATVALRKATLALEEKLKDDALVKLTPTVAAQLKEEFPKKRDEIMGKSRKEAEPLVVALSKQVNDAVEAARALKSARERFKTEIESLAGEMKKLDKLLQTAKGDSGAKYTGELRTLLESAAKNTKVESKAAADRIDADLKRVREGIRQYADGKAPAGDLVKDQAAADAARAQAARRKDEWKKAYEAFRKGRLAEASKRVKGEARGDVKALDDLVALAQRTDETARKSEDWDSAFAQLPGLEQRAQALVDEPQGARRTARKNVGQLAQRWNETVTTFRRNLEAFIGETEKQVLAAADELKADPANAAQEKALRDAAAGLRRNLLPVRDLFDGHAFDRSIPVLADDERAEAERLAAREEGLRQVRRMRELVNTDPRVRHLVMNPFKGGLVTGLQQTLSDLELNLLRGV